MDGEGRVVPVTIGGQEVRRGETIGQARDRLGRPRNRRTTAEAETPFDAEAAATITNLLHTMGLDALTGEVDRWVRNGLSWPEIEARLMDPSTDAGEIVDQIYPELREYRENPLNEGMPPINIAYVQSYRQTLNQFIQARGYEAAFPTAASVNEAARRWITGGKSMVEMQERFDLLESNAVFEAQTNPEIALQLEAWQRWYGQAPTTGDLVALALNPEEATPLITKRFAAVRFDREAGIAGFGDLSQEEGERLADLGVDAAQSGQGFGALARNRELFDPLDAGEDAISRQDQLDAAFTNSSAAQRRIADRAARRAAAFQGGGRLATSRGGGFGGLSTRNDF